jgi:hypothetical protein
MGLELNLEIILKVLKHFLLLLCHNLKMDFNFASLPNHYLIKLHLLVFCLLLKVCLLNYLQVLSLGIRIYLDLL